MKTAKIAYHLNQAAWRRAVLDLGPPRPVRGRRGGGGGYIRLHETIARHEAAAAALLAEGLREYANLSTKPRNAYARRWRQTQPKGPGRGKRGMRGRGQGGGWTRHDAPDTP